MTRSVLISGAGVAGASLAYWLGTTGNEVTVVERAEALRTSSAGPVDFRGDQLALLAKMGVLSEIKANETGMGDQQVIDKNGRRQSTFPSALFSGDIEIERQDLVRILHNHSEHKANYVYGNHVTALKDTPNGVEVTFAHGPQSSFDLVIGADGLHSAIRRLAMDDKDARHDLGLGIAGFRLPNTFGLDHTGLIYNEPGRMAMVSSGRDTTTAGVGLLFAATNLDYDRHNTADQKRIVADHFQGSQWRIPDLISALQETEDLYFDTISQIRLPHWSTGRIALLGDAAWCTGPGGNGTGHAMLGAYTLAGELALSNDHETAYQRYEQYMRPNVAKSQKTAAGAAAFLTPATERKIRNRNRMFRVLSAKPMAGVFGLISKRTANTGTLRDYPLLQAAEIA